MRLSYPERNKNLPPMKEVTSYWVAPVCRGGGVVCAGDGKVGVAISTGASNLLLVIMEDLRPSSCKCLVDVSGSGTIGGSGKTEREKSLRFDSDSVFVLLKVLLDRPAMFGIVSVLESKANGFRISSGLARNPCEDISRKAAMLWSSSLCSRRMASIELTLP